jgi:hypothetical protein
VDTNVSEENALSLRQYVLQKHWYPPTGLCGFIYQMTANWRWGVMITSDCTKSLKPRISQTRRRNVNDYTVTHTPNYMYESTFSAYLNILTHNRKCSRRLLAALTVGYECYLWIGREFQEFVTNACFYHRIYITTFC